jgi:hypothetical protein
LVCLVKAVFVANKRALLERKAVLDAAYEMLERFETHLTAQGVTDVGLPRQNLDYMLQQLGG